MSDIVLVEAATQAFWRWVAALTDSDQDCFGRAQTLATRLGAYYRSDGLTEIAFWVPDLSQAVDPSLNGATRNHYDQIQQAKDIYLEVLTPLEPLDFRAPRQVIPFRCDRVPLKRQQDYFFGVFSGLHPGTREQAGSFYWLRYLDAQNQLQTIGDVMAYSLPYGVFAPAELYDIDGLQRRRADLDYFSQGPMTEQGTVKVAPPGNILQIYVSTATQARSLAGLTRLYTDLADKVRSQAPLTPAEENYLGYDAVQLLPIEPVVEYRTTGSARPGFWHQTGAPAAVVTVTLNKPDTIDWGYDVVLAASSATNPALLESLRPDELVDFIATLHGFPTGSIQVIYDLVYGHADNQAKALLNEHFLRGANMYGQNVNYQDPIIRALLLEMQRRKINTGADGIRVDGAQDFKFYDARSGQLKYDDDYLTAMSLVPQNIGGSQRQLFAIFEDGRPWPRADWEESSTYLDVINQQPEAYQWGPLIFAHNTPALSQFWDKKWLRVCEVMDHGSHWITGCANHDTMRRGAQLDPQANINWNLGQTLPEVIKRAYDNPAVALLFYGFSPGIPMDFLNATMRAPWCFFRNVDDIYGLKVIAEEARFLDWQVEPGMFDDPTTFVRLKQLGIDNLAQLRAFTTWLNKTVADVGDNYDLDDLAQRCQVFLASRDHPHQVITAQILKTFAKDYLEDCCDLCQVDRYTDRLAPQQTRFNLNLRRYRQAHPWLRENLTPQDSFSRTSDDHTTLFYGLRSNPLTASSDRPESIILVTHLGGEPAIVTLADWLAIDLAQWQIVCTSPNLGLKDDMTSLSRFELQDGQGVLLELRPAPLKDQGLRSI